MNTKKQVRWGTQSVLEFRVGYNASTVPLSGGPPIGLVGHPIRHSYSMIPEQRDDETTENIDKLSTKKTRDEMWICPMERVRILKEENHMDIEDITLICTSVRTILDMRSYSRFDHVAEQMLRSAEVIRLQDLRNLRYSFHDSRTKVVLY